MTRSVAHFLPARLILISILLAIGCATLILKLPACYQGSLSWIDSLFAATSCLCICGLWTVPFTNFTLFGQCVILMLIQIGGLGLITLTFFLMSFFIKFGFTTQVIAGQLMEFDSWKDIKKFVFFIICFTALIEILFAAFIFFVIHHNYSLLYALFLSIFHAVSSFCHAGISIFPQGLGGYKLNLILLLVNALVIVTAGIGFITWYEMLNYVQSLKEHKRFHFSLQTKIVLYTTFFLIISSTMLFWMLERHNTLEDMSSLAAMVNAFFNGVTIRGTGFATVPTDYLQSATLLLIILMSFIGSAPGAMGSGIKVTTFAIFIETIRAAIVGKTSVSLLGRSLAKDQVFKALAIVFLAICWIFITTFILLITEQSFSFIDIFFEAASAFATLGLSLGITPWLSPIGKIFVIMTMIIGRVGSLAFILALYRRQDKPEFSYPEERILVG